jgi:LysM repeat protein
VALLLAFALASLAAVILANGGGLKVEFTQPAPGSTVTQDKIEVVLSVSPTDRDLARVELFVDGTAHNSLKLGGKPHEKVKLTWNTPDFSAGSHTLSVRLIDSEGSVAEAQAQFNLERPKPSTTLPSAPEATPSGAPTPAPAAADRPGVKIAKPAANAELAGAVEVAIEAQCPSGVSVVFLLIDGSHVFISNVTPYVFAWDTTKWPNGSHTLMAKASSPRGVEGMSQSLKVVVNNPGGRTEMELPPAQAQTAESAPPAKEQSPAPSAPVRPGEPAPAAAAPAEAASAAIQRRPESAPPAASLGAKPSPGGQALARQAAPPEPASARIQPPAVSAQPKKQPAPAAPAPAKQPVAPAAKAPAQPPAVSAPPRSAAAPAKAESTQIASLPGQPGRKPSSAGQATTAQTLARVHVVAPGQGLFAVARLYAVPVKELASLNGLEMNSRLAVGQKLLLPAPVPVLFVSGEQVESDVAPALHDSVMFGPLRHIVASAGGRTEWRSDHGGGTATAYLERENLSVSIGAKTAVLNGSKIALAIAPYLEKGRTMVPIRLLERLFGWAIHYNASARRADIAAKQA